MTTEESAAVRPGPTDSLVDVPGLRVGHATATGEGWLTGTTVVLAPDGGAVAGVDVRGGGPGTRETDLLDPRNMVERVHAVVLGGGSAFGLAAADGVMDRLARDGIGLPVADGVTVPIVPAAVIFDLGRGGDVTCRPSRETGQQASDAATAAGSRGGPEGGGGAGAGAVAGGLKGGVGSASALLPGGRCVAALAVVNALGSAVDPRTGELYAARLALPGDLPALHTPDAAQVRTHRERLDALRRERGLRAGTATTIGVVATDAALTKAQCAKVAGIAHDGLARGIRPVHTMFDGDTIFTLATGDGTSTDPAAFHEVLETAADCFTRAIARAMLAARTTETPAGRWPSYPDAFPSAISPETKENSR